MSRDLGLIAFLIFLVSVPSVHFSKTSGIANVLPSDLLAILHSKCAVVYSFSSGLDTNTPLENVLAKLEYVTSKTMALVHTSMSLSELTGNQIFTLDLPMPSTPTVNFVPSGPFILILRRFIPDRTCLLKSALKPKITGTLYVGPVSLDSLLPLVNEHCDTHFQPSGSLTENGMRMRNILDNLYSVHTLHMAAPNLQQLATECGVHDNLKQFFYSGNCSRQNSSHLTSQETCDASQTTTRTMTCSKEFAPPVILPKCDETVGIPTKRLFLKDYLFRSRPVIFRNAIHDWPAMKRWTNEFFRENFPTVKLHVKLTPEGEFEGVEPLTLWENHDKFYIPSEVRAQLKFPDLVMVRPAGVDMNLTYFLDVVEGKTAQANFSAYLEYTPFEDIIRNLTTDIRELPLLQDELKLELTNLWFSNGKTLGKLHFDQFDNFLCQISGKKQAILIEPYANEALYEGHILEGILSYNSEKRQFRRQNLMQSTAMTMSPINIVKPDCDKFPLSCSLLPVNCTINPGDVLYLPAFWWHEVQSFPDAVEQRNIAVNFWTFRPRPKHCSRTRHWLSIWLTNGWTRRLRPPALYPIDGLEHCY